MGDFADRNAIDALAADLFRNDHPDRCWDPSDGMMRIGTASAIERAVYRGFATARLSTKPIPEPAIAAAALAASRGTIKPRV